MRIAKAQYEMEQAIHFDKVVINDDLSQSVAEALQMVRNFLINNINSPITLLIMKRKIGLYFGSFNPVHIGHLIGQSLSRTQ